MGIAFWDGMFSFLTVAAVFVFVLCIIQMAFRHAQNMKRIQNGYPTLDGARPDHYRESNENDSMDRLQ